MAIGDFDSAVLATVSGIPAGTVLAYGEVARRAGFPGRARQVGRLLAGLPGDSTIPWHRVVRADRKLGFAPGTRGFRRQQTALAAEGVLLAGGRVPPDYFNASATGRLAT